MNGELISRSKCKPAASPSSQTCIQKVINATNPADTISTETESQLIRNHNSIQLSLDRTESIERQIGRIEILFLENQLQQQSIVFLPQSASTIAFPNLEQLTIPVISEQAIEGSISNTLDNHLQPVNVDLSFPEELFWTNTALPANDIRQGELNTPEIGKTNCNIDNVCM